MRGSAASTSKRHCLNVRETILNCARGAIRADGWRRRCGTAFWRRPPLKSIVRYERRTAWLGGEFPTDGIGFEIGDVTFFVPELVSVYDILPPSPNKDRTEIFMDDLRLDIDNY